jgi:hypothetical protein
MGKNSLIFHRLPNGYYGLVKWYPELKKQKKVTAPGQAANGEEESLEEEQEVTEGE